MFKPTLCGGFVLGMEVKTAKPLPKPPKPLDWFPSLSPNWSYFNFLSVSDKTSYADDILKFSSASLLSGFTSG
jgi:hypothetical protein